jgi:hypothetical protein
MDVNTRIDHMDEELKLVKNEIKQVLLEIQEHVLNIQNPFSQVVVGSRSDDVGGAGGAGAAAAEAPPVQQEVPAQPEPQIPGFDPNQLQGVGAGQGGFPVQQQQGFQGYPAQPPQGMGGPQYPAPGAQQGGPPDPNAGAPGGDWAEREQRSQGLSSRKFDVGDDLLGDYDLGDIADLGADEADDWADEEDDGVGFNAVDDEDDYKFDEEEDEAEEDYEDEYEDEDEDEEAAPKRGRKGKKGVVEELEEEDPTADLDLVTLASLVQWTDRVVQRAGPEYLEALFEISEMTGRLSADLKNTLLVLVKLLSIEVNGSSVGATETVRLLAQLDGLMGNTTKEDARLLPFILDGNNLEVLSLIQQ